MNAKNADVLLMSRKPQNGEFELGHCELIDAPELAARWRVPESWIRNHTRARPRRKSAFPVCVWADMSGSSGDRRSSSNGWRNISTRSVSSLLVSLDVLTGKHDNRCMGKKPNPHAQALGKKGGTARAKNLSDAEIAKIASKGGKARAAKLSGAELSRIAKLAVQARERKRKAQQKENN